MGLSQSNPVREGGRGVGERDEAGEVVEGREKKAPYEGEDEGVARVSSVTTPYVGGGAVRVWDPTGGPVNGGRGGGGFNQRQGSIWAPAYVGDEVCTNVYLIRCAESTASALPELVGGRSPSALLTAEGKRQARALGVYFLSHGFHFDAVLTSPLERCKQTALSVCQEIKLGKERLEFAEDLVEMSQGVWEGLRKSEVYTMELLNIMANLHQDFHAPGGESQRQVEFRMMEFVNSLVLTKAIASNLHKDTRFYYTKQNMSSPLTHVQIQENASKDDSVVLLAKNSNLLVKEKGKSRVRVAPPSTDISMNDMSLQATPPPYHVLMFSHEMAIKCFLRGLLGSHPHMTDRICIYNTSITIVRHSTHSGWRIMRVNDTSHLRLL